MKKKVFSWIMIVAIMACLCVPVSADFDPATRDSVAVVYTCLDLDGGEYGFGWGSGFFVGELDQDPTYLITNYHVIEDFVEYGAGELSTISVDGVTMTGRSKIRVHFDSDDYEEAYVVGYDSIKDIALLKLGGPTSKRKAIAIQEATDAMVGSPVYAVGYPGLAENVFADSTSSWGKSDSTVTSGTISRLFLTAGTGTASIQIDCAIKSGNSGGPLVNDDGAAIGINTYSVNDGGTDSINYAINVSEAIGLLNQYRIPYVLAGEAAAAPAEESAEAETSVEAAPEPEAKTSSFPVIPVVIAVAVVAIAAIVAAVAISGSKKKKKAAPAAQRPVQQPVQAAPVQRAAAKRGYVRSLAAQHRGSAVPVSGQPVYLGRGKDCAVVYENNTPGVSGRHASLSFDPASGEFTLTDLSSTYGTYLQNGQKLTPNMAYRLRSGDQFYLGESGNMLRVTVE